MQKEPRFHISLPAQWKMKGEGAEGAKDLL